MEDTGIGIDPYSGLLRRRPDLREYFAQHLTYALEAPGLRLSDLCQRQGPYVAGHGACAREIPPDQRREAPAFSRVTGDLFVLQEQGRIGVRVEKNETVRVVVNLVRD